MDENVAPKNRLSIAHLLAWMTVTAILFGLQVWNVAYERSMTLKLGLASQDLAAFQEFMTKLHILQYCAIPFHGMAIASVILWPLRRWQFRGGFPTMPGHWLLLASGIGLTVHEISWRLISALLPDLEQMPDFETARKIGLAIELSDNLFPVAFLSVIGLGLYAGLGSRTWTISFALLVTGMVLFCLVELLRAFVGYPVVTLIWVGVWSARTAFGIGLFLTLATAAQESQSQMSRDFTHYAGIAVVTAIAAHRVAEWLLARLT